MGLVFFYVYSKENCDAVGPLSPDIKMHIPFNVLPTIFYGTN